MSVTAWQEPRDLVRVPMSYEDYLTIPAHIHAEWVDGVVVMAPSGRYEHNEIAVRLLIAFRSALPDTAQMLDTTIYLPGNRERRPDVTVTARPPHDGYPRVAVDGPPVLVVKVLSPSTEPEYRANKSSDYALAGIGQYWLVDPAQPRLTVLELLDGEWQPLLLLDAQNPSGVVTVGGHGAVPVDLPALLDV